MAPTGVGPTGPVGGEYAPEEVSTNGLVQAEDQARLGLAQPSARRLVSGLGAPQSGVRPRDCHGYRSYNLSGAQVAQAAAVIQPMSPCRLPFSRTAKGGGNRRGDRTDNADAGMGLPVNGCRSPDGDRPSDVIAVRCRGCLQCGPCPGLSKCRARLILADGEKRGRSTAPGGRQQRTPPIPGYPLAGVALQSGRLDQARLHYAALKPGPAECGRGRSPDAVSMASR